MNRRRTVHVYAGPESGPTIRANGERHERSFSRLAVSAPALCMHVCVLRRCQRSRRASSDHLSVPLFTSVHLCSPLFTSVRLCSPLCAAVALTEFTVDISSSTIFRPATSSSTPSWSACPARRRAFSTSCCDANKEMIQPCLIYLHLISSVGHSKRPVSANAHRVCYTPC